MRAQIAHTPAGAIYPALTWPPYGLVKQSWKSIQRGEKALIRILLADHHTQALWALKTTLQEQAGFEVVGDATDAETLFALSKEHLPDLILLDWELPGTSIEELIADLRSLEPKPIVVVMGSKPEYGRLMLKAGADAFTSKVDQPDWLLAALKKFDRNPGQT